MKSKHRLCFLLFFSFVLVTMKRQNRSRVESQNATKKARSFQLQEMIKSKVEWNRLERQREQRQNNRQKKLRRDIQKRYNSHW